MNAVTNQELLGTMALISNTLNWVHREDACLHERAGNGLPIMEGGSSCALPSCTMIKRGLGWP